MGVTGSALTAVLGLAGGILLSYWLEFQFRSTRPGPAAAIESARERQPIHPDGWLYPAGPVTALLGIAMAGAVIPYGPGWIGADLSIALFYFIVVVDFVVLGVALAGWGANTPSAVESCYRIVAQLVAYVIPLGLAIIGPIMMARSLSTVEIVEGQRGLWYLVSQPLGFCLYIITALMQVYRTPFLEPFSENIEAGILSVFGGWKALVWRISLSGLLFVVSAMGAVLFLGGWLGPWLPGPLWMFLKTFAVMSLLLWGGRQVKARSVSQMLELAWKILIPVGLFNVLIVGALILLGVGQ